MMYPKSTLFNDLQSKQKLFSRLIRIDLFTKLLDLNQSVCQLCITIMYFNEWDKKNTSYLAHIDEKYDTS